MDGIIFRLIRLLPLGQNEKNRVIATFVDAAATEGKPNKKLFDQIRDVMRLKQYALRTERAYID
jgi:hypothetical protein